MNISKTNIIIFLILIFSSFVGYFLFERYFDLKKNIICEGSENKYDCWREVLSDTLQKKGLDSAFSILAELYSKEPKFVAECHSYTHELGEISYKMFSKNEKIVLTPKASYCGYGFYHGFMETLLHSGSGIKQAKDFCKMADEQLSKYGSKTSLACYHGIGHGAVDGGDPRSWGSPKKLIEPGLKICKIISDLPIDIHQCGTGVFNALAIAMNSNSFQLNNSDNPYNICLNQENIFKPACYEQMNTRVAKLSNNDFSQAVKFVLDIKEQKNAILAMSQLSPVMISREVGQNKNFDKEIRVCKSLPEYIKKPCIEGLAGGILEFGKPNSEYLEAINFCESKGLNEIEKNICYDYLVSNSRILYSEEVVNKICSIIDLKYRGQCNK